MGVNIICLADYLQYYVYLFPGLVTATPKYEGIKAGHGVGCFQSEDCVCLCLVKIDFRTTSWFLGTLTSVLFHDTDEEWIHFPLKLQLPFEWI